MLPTTTPLRLEQIPPGVLGKWMLMAFVAGNVNAGGFMACERFVTHVTGFATLFGVQVAGDRWLDAWGMLSVPAFFLLGCMIAAYFIDVAITQGRPPRFGLVMKLVAALLALVAVSGHSGGFGAFDMTFKLERDYLFLVLLCMASGLQNAAMSTASGTVMRCTHLTGLTTDLGVGIARLLFGRGRWPARLQELRRNWIRLGVIASFAVGGVAGAVLFSYVDYLGFLLPAVVAVYCGNLGERVYALALASGQGVARRREDQHAG